MKNRVVIVQGSQWGSEAKGAVALALCERLGVKWAVRTGSINAGHSVWINNHKIAFQQLPVGCVLPGVKVIIGPGAYVSQQVLDVELVASGCGDRLILDSNCGVHLEEYADEAAHADRKLKIGATGKGCAEAILHKIKDRGVGVPLLFREELEAGKYKFDDTARLLNDAYDRGERILIEGTQGTLLDFHCGPYPFVTSRQTIAAAWVAEAGLSPALDYEICLVARTFPIRVAGNSGPMGKEISWPALAQQMNTRLRLHDLPPIVREEALGEFWLCKERAVEVVRTKGGRTWAENALLINTEALALMTEHGRAEVLKLFEATTVTKRVRRIAELDRELLKLTVHKERPAYLALTFINYVFPELVPEHNPRRLLHDEARRWIEQLQEEIGCRIKYTSIGPRSEDLLEI